MSEMIERVAQALRDQGVALGHPQQANNAARAAIAAMRTPTSHMEIAGHDAGERALNLYTTHPFPEFVWKAMIDAALESK